MATVQQTTYTLYNLQRQRIADLNADGHITRQYIWLGDQLVATLDANTSKTLQAPADDVLSKLTQTMQTLWQTTTGQTDQLAFVHVNHLHAPVAVTNTQAQIIWQADYAPYGEIINTAYALNGSQTQPRNKLPTNTQQTQTKKADKQSAHYTIALRNAGQWQDDETGLYYNDQRYYHPQTGRYISADPLGKLAAALGSPNPYSYVSNNPVSYIDPWGLILFAFDGTNNTDDLAWLNDPKHNSSLSNVVQFRNLYESDSGKFNYVTGVGTEHKDAVYGNIVPPVFDDGFNFTGVERINRMVKYFNDESDNFDDEVAMDVDIISFSRGAANARDFANQIVANTQNGWYSYTDKDGQAKCQKVNFRFMGLWDTVLSTNAGRSYNMAIPDAFAYVAQAVALNEHRGKALRQLPGSIGAFPLDSILNGMMSVNPVANQTRIEKGFIGAHANIGGGFAEGQNQLSQVALAWMVEQAKSAGVKMTETTFTIKANPVIHDKSDNQYSETGKPPANEEDRTVTYGDGTNTKQKQMVGTGLTWQDTQAFINYLPPTLGEPLPSMPGQPSQPNIIRLPNADYTIGTVDMKKYLSWLKDNGYNINMIVQ